MTTSRLVFDEKHRVGAWVAQQVGQQSSWGDFYAMGAELGGQLVSGVVVNQNTDSNAMVHLVVSRPTRLMSVLFDHTYLYAFRQLGLKRLTAPVEETNVKSLKLCKHVGFEEEAVLKHAGTNGADLHLLVMWPQNYRGGRLYGQV